jgi:hypothetical protein
MDTSKVKLVAFISQKRKPLPFFEKIKFYSKPIGQQGERISIYCVNIEKIHKSSIGVADHSANSDRVRRCRILIEVYSPDQ